MAVPGALGLALAAIGAQAQSNLFLPSQNNVSNYSGQRRQVKACVLVSDAAFKLNGTARVPQNVTPYVFQIMDQRSEKPAGWEFVNPLASSNITGDMIKRWGTDRPASNTTTDPTFDTSIFRTGAPLLKSMGPYWEVNLDKVSSDDLQQFDIALIVFRGNGISSFVGGTNSVAFTPDEREKLRRFVDAGGNLWLDDGGNYGFDNVHGPFIVNVSFGGGVGRRRLASTHHPLVNFPYGINGYELFRLGSFNQGFGARRHTDPGGGSVAPGIMTPVIYGGGGGGARAFVSAGAYGAGHLVISSGIAYGISGAAGGANIEGGNSGALCGSNLLAVNPVDLKFAYNIISWTTSVPTASADVRRTASTHEQIGAQLARKWATIPVNGNGVGSGAVIHKGVVFYVDGNSVLHAYDSNPGTDLDNDGNPDDGIQDPPNAPYDEIWRAPLQVGDQARVSTPTVLSVTINNTPRDEVAVMTDQGKTFIYNAFPTTANGRTLSGTGVLLFTISQDNHTKGDGLFDADKPLPSPAFSEGLLFTLLYVSGAPSGDNWRVAPIDPITGNNVFGDPNAVAPTAQNLGGQLNGLPTPVGSLTVGYIRDEASGALEKVVYVPTKWQQANQNQNVGYVYGMHFSTRHEPLTLVTNTANLFSPMFKRAELPWFAPPNPAANVQGLLPVIYVVRRTVANGPVTGVERYPYTGGIGNVTITFAGTQPNRTMQVQLTGVTVNPTDSVFADYTLDWPGAAIGTAGTMPTAQEMDKFSSGRHFDLQQPVQSDTQSKELPLGTTVLGPQDTLLFNAAASASVGGTGGRIYSVRQRYAVGGGTGQTSGTQVAWMFSPTDSNQFDTVTVPPRLVNTDSFTPAGLTAASSPITGFQAVGSPVLSNDILYVLGTTGGGGAVLLALRANPSTTFPLKQQILDSVNATGVQIQLAQVDPLQSSVGALTQPAYIRLTEGTNFTLDRESGTVTITNFKGDKGVFNTVLPIVVMNGPNVLDTITRSNSIFGPLDNLAWYMVIPSSIAPPPTSSPSLFGSVLYYGTGNGQVVSVDLKGISGSGGQTPLYASTRATNPRVFVQQMVDPNSGSGGTILSPPLGTTNLVAIGGANALAALENQLTLVADNNRLVEVDYGSNAVWTLDSTRILTIAGGAIGFGGTGQAAITKISLNRPNMARRSTLNEFVVADTGNNRLIQTDRAGNVTWELRNLNNDLLMLRPGDPLALNQPTDVQIYPLNGDTISIKNEDTGVTYTWNGPYTSTHYVIADSGNYRALEVVDATGPGGFPVVLTGSDGSSVTLQRQVIFVTRSLAEQNKHFRYRTIQQFLDPADGLTYMIAAIDNVRPAALDPGAVAFGQNGPNVEAPGGSLMVLQRYVAPDGKQIATVDSVAIPDGKGGFTQQAISNPTWFKRFAYKDPTAPANAPPKSRYLLADDNGCYELEPDANNNAVVKWMLSAKDYYQMTGRRLRASSIQRLTQADFNANTQQFYPHYLITNRYIGQDNIPEVFFNTSNMAHGDIHGEVFEIRGIDYYVNGGYQPLYAQAGTFLQRNPNSSIVWMAPNETIPTDTNGIPIPGPIKRSIGSPDGATTTGLFEQPTFSDRPF
jgi:hypothetical protein